MTVFSDLYSAASPLLKSDDPLLISGKLEKGEKGAKILVRRQKEQNGNWQPQRHQRTDGDIRLLCEARAQTTRKVSFNLAWTTCPSERLDGLR